MYNKYCIELQHYNTTVKHPCVISGSRTTVQTDKNHKVMQKPSNHHNKRIALYILQFQAITKTKVFLFSFHKRFSKIGLPVALLKLDVFW